MPCKHESCGQVKGISVDAFEDQTERWASPLHVCRKCRNLYVELPADLPDQPLTLYFALR